MWMRGSPGEEVICHLRTMRAKGAFRLYIYIRKLRHINPCAESYLNNYFCAHRHAHNAHTVLVTKRLLESLHSCGSHRDTHRVHADSATHLLYTSQHIIAHMCGAPVNYVSELCSSGIVRNCNWFLEYFCSLSRRYEIRSAALDTQHIELSR